MIARALVVVAVVAAGTLACAPKAAPSAVASAAPMQGSSAEFDSAVEALLVANGTRRTMRMVRDSMFGGFRRAFPQVPSEFWDSASTQESDDSLIVLLIPVYEKNLTLDEVRQLTAFYQSPLGVKLMAAQPAIFAESYTVGREFGQRRARRMLEKLRAKGYVKST